MADVQIDSGEFTRIANILLEKSAQLHLNGTQYSIILTVWRFTYGFQRKEHDLSVSFIANSTGVSGRAIKKELKILIDRNILLVTRESTGVGSRTLKFNKDYESWLVGNNQSPLVGNKTTPLNIASGEQPIPRVGNNQSPLVGNKTTPKKESKENYKESIYIIFSHWNSKKIITHKSLNEKTAGHINARFEEGFSLDEILSAIDNYKIILGDNDLYFWTYKWGLGDFMVRGLDKFKTESDPFTNYVKKDKSKPKSPKDNPSKTPKGKYDNFYL